MKLAWLTDIHLDFLGPEEVSCFQKSLSTIAADAILIGGDIGQADSVAGFLRAISDSAPCPTYFVLGNHDFYRGSFQSACTAVRSVTSPKLIWLTEADVQLLNESIALIGDDTWADARLGIPYETPVLVNDFFLIDDLRSLTRSDLVTRYRQLGDESAKRLAPKLEAAAQARPIVVLLLHVPPFHGATWYKGRISNDEYLPWFSCQTVGDAILRTARTYPETTFWVLCGHTHNAGRYEPLPNVTVLTGDADYGRPAIHGILDPMGSGLMSHV